MDAVTMGWGDYIIAGALDESGKHDQALALYKKIAANNAVDSGRRGWAIYQASTILAAKTPVAALDYADTGLGLQSDAIPVLYSLYANTAISNGLADRLKDRLIKLIDSKPEKLDDILLKTSGAAGDLIESGHQPEALSLIALLKSIEKPAVTGDAFAHELDRITSESDSLASRAKAQRDLKQLLAAFPDIAALEKKQPAFSSANDAVKAESQHEDSGEVNDALGVSERLAIGFPVDKNFTDYFWDCAKNAEWAVRSGTTPPADGFFAKLGDLAEELPHSCDAYADTRLLLGEWLARTGHRPDAAKIFDALAGDKNLSAGFQGPIALQTGLNGEESGDEKKALASYRSAEACTDTQDRAREAVLRAIFIQLQNGDKTEAARLVKLLSDSAKKNKIKVAEQVRDVIVLADDPAGAADFWNNWNAWWPKWQQIETAAGLDPVKNGKLVPIIPSLRELGKSIGGARNNKETKNFFEVMRQMAYAARMYPNAALEFVGAFGLAEEMLPDHADDIRRLGISILEPLKVTDPVYRRSRLLNLLVNYVDTNQNDKAINLIHRDWAPELEDGGVVALAVHRVWAVAATRQNQDLPAVHDLLLADLKAPGNSTYGETVEMLARVDASLGRVPEGVDLLKTALASPALANADATRRVLTAILENLQGGSQTSKQLADGVAAWLKDHKPSWWDYAEQKSTDDPRFVRLQDILKSPKGEFQPAELMKAGLLAPSLPSLDATTQQTAVLRAFAILLSTLDKQSDADGVAKSILDNPSFPPSFKQDFLYSFLLDAYQNRQLTSYENFRKQPIADQLPSQEKDLLGRIDSFFQVDKTSAPALKAYLKNISTHPLDDLDVGVLEDAVQFLLKLGDVDSVQAIYQDLANETLAATATRTKPQIQLGLLKALNAAKEGAPVSDAFRQVTLSTFKPEAITKPEFFDQWRSLSGLAGFSAEDSTKLRLYLVKNRQNQESLYFWYGLMHDMPHDSAYPDFCLAMLKAGLNAASADDTKATLVRFGGGLLDLDNPQIYERFKGLLQPYRDPVKFPLTMENIRLIDVSQLLRQGKPVNVDTDLSGFNDPINSNHATRLKLRDYILARNMPKLKEFLNGMSADDILAPDLLQTTLPALQAAGMTDEAMLARSTMEKQLYNDVLAAWLESTKLDRVRGDIEALHSSADLPSAFTDLLNGRQNGSRDLEEYRILTAYFRNDWNAVSQAGAAYVQQFPTYYSMEWYYGRSLAELGKNAEAIHALTIYCTYSKDELCYPDAETLLAKLKETAKN